MKHFLFERIAIAIAIVALAITPIVYFVGYVILALMPELEANSIAAMVSAIISLLIFITMVWQIGQNYRRNRLLVRPLIGSSLFTSRTGNKIHITFEIVNYGIGPAIIENAILFFEGDEELRNSVKKYTDFFNKHLKNFNTREIGFIVPNSIMKTTEEQVIWEIKYHDKKCNVDFIKKLDLRIEYKSIYGEKMPAYDTRKDIKFIEQKSL